MAGSDTVAFAVEGRKARQTLRIRLHESAVALRRERIEAEMSGIRIAVPLAERIRALGFHGAAEAVFDLLPLVHVAWADGAVQPRERNKILELLERRAVAGDAGWDMILTLLEQRPSDEYLEESLAVVAELLSDDSSHAKSVVAMCVTVAEAAGGFLRVRRISREERALIERIADALGPAGRAEFKLRML